MVMENVDYLSFLFKLVVSEKEWSQRQVIAIRSVKCICLSFFCIQILPFEISNFAVSK